MPHGAGFMVNGVVLRDNGKLTTARLRNAFSRTLQLGAFGTMARLVWCDVVLDRKAKPAPARTNRQCSRPVALVPIFVSQLAASLWF